MICRKCGNKLPDGSKFCTVCGADQTQMRQTPVKQTTPPATPERSRRGSLAALITILSVLLLGALGLLFYSFFLEEPAGISSPDCSLQNGTGTTSQTEMETEPNDNLQTSGPTDPDQTITETTAPPLTAEDQAQLLLENMSTEEMVYQLFVVTPEALTGEDAVLNSSAGLADALAAMPVGGVILAERNISTPEQCSALINAMQEASGTPMFIAVNEEGGRYTEISSNSAMGVAQPPLASEISDEQAAYDNYLSLAQSILALGFNLNLAPVADVNSNPDNVVMGQRAFGSDADTVGRMVVSAARGLSDGDVIPCLKHFPGHGDVVTDSYAYTYKSLEELKATELVSFAAGIDAGLPMIMAGYIACPEVTGDELPAPLSHSLIQTLLRAELGFEGVVMTDVLLREDISRMFPDGQAAVMSLQAGCDLLLMPGDIEATAQAILQALETGNLDAARLEEIVLRILKLKVEYGIIPAASV